MHSLSLLPKDNQIALILNDAQFEISKNELITLSSSDDEERLMRMNLDSSDSDNEDQFVKICNNKKEKYSSADAIAPNGKTGETLQLVHIVEGLDVLIHTHHRRGTAFQVWPAACVLVRWLTQNYSKYIAGRVVLELGAGTGVASIALVKFSMQLISACLCNGKQLSSIIAQSFTITDVHNAVPVIDKNIALNCIDARGAVTTALRVKSFELDWFAPICSDIEKPDVIIVSDCLYHEDLFEPLLATLRVLLLGSPDRSTVAYLAQYPRRNSVEKRFFKAARKIFEVQVLHREKIDPADRQFCSIYQIRSKQMK